MPEIFIAPKKKEIKKGKLGKRPVESGGFLKQAKTALSAFVANPRDIHFENQEDGEIVLYLLRAHWVTNLHWIIIAFLMIFAPIIVFPTLSFLKFLSILPLRFQTVFLVFWYIFIFSYVFISFLSWYFNVFIITNRRLIDVDFLNLLYKEISTCEVDKVQDVTYKVAGTLGVMFDFGNVFVQTAGAEKNIEFEQVPRPAFVAKKITELMKKIN